MQTPWCSIRARSPTAANPMNEMNICALSGVVIVGSLRIDEAPDYVVFTVRTRNGMPPEEDSVLVQRETPIGRKS